MNQFWQCYLQYIAPKDSSVVADVLYPMPLAFSTSSKGVTCPICRLFREWGQPCLSCLRDPQCQPVQPSMFSPASVHTMVFPVLLEPSYAGWERDTLQTNCSLSSTHGSWLPTPTVGKARCHHKQGLIVASVYKSGHREYAVLYCMLTQSNSKWEI
jgi:hypothetical protein